MRLLLTSGGIRNASIRSALVDLLGKPIEEAAALLIPTAAHTMPTATDQLHRIISGDPGMPFASELPWRRLGVLELTALPTVPRAHWVAAVRDADALLVHGGDAVYLAYWLRRSGLADVLDELGDTVWVGLSAGSMVLTPRIGREFTSWQPPLRDGDPPRGRDDVEVLDDTALGLVGFSLFPHLGAPSTPNTVEAAERWAARLDVPSFAIDDDTAIAVVDGEVRVVSEGTWMPLGGADSIIQA